MLKLSTEELNKLIDNVIAKKQWTQNKLSQELNIKPERISRWRAGAGIHQGHYDALMQLLGGGPELQNVEKIRPPIEIPFSITIPRSSLRVSTDKNGNINIAGVMLAFLNKEDQ